LKLSTVRSTPKESNVNFPEMIKQSLFKSIFNFVRKGIKSIPGKIAGVSNDRSGLKLINFKQKPVLRKVGKKMGQKKIYQHFKNVPFY
jgi:hypothetical protein